MSNAIPRRHILAALAMAAAVPHAWSQSYPDKPITLVVPYPAGASVDRIGRVLALELGKRLGTPVVVENIGGASGTIGARKVERAAADGYTLLVGSVNDLIVGPAALKSGYSIRDFTAIAKLSTNSTALVVSPGLAVNNVDELAAFAKRSGKPLLMGATGVAMMQTIGGKLVADAAGFEVTPVVYKGGAPLLTDLAGGQVQVGTIALTGALPMIRAGKLKVLGVISAHRDPTAPDIPTVNEGKTVKGVEADLWTGLFGPAALPGPVVARLAAVMREVLADAAYREGEFKAGSIAADPGDPQRFQQLVVNEENRLRPMLANLETK
jgi:tripartite-type tricarboxylate transporter receptor subunit TctC